MSNVQKIACPKCGKLTAIDQFVANHMVCPKAYCGHYLVLSAQQRLGQLVDSGTFAEWDAELTTANPLDFPGYAEKLAKLSAQTGQASGVVTGIGQIAQQTAVIAVTDYTFMVGAMNSVVGEKLARAIDRATEQRQPIVLVCGSGGGAMMYEGIVSLMQMPIVVGALAAHTQAGLMSIGILTEASFGGVMASWASLTNITLAEPKAKIGFVGSRVVGGKMLEKAPRGFRTAEYQQRQGAIDAVVSRAQLKSTIAQLLRWAHQPAVLMSPGNLPEPVAIHRTDRYYLVSTAAGQGSLPIATVLGCARNPKRPRTLDYVYRIFTDFYELHGDRCNGDDGAIVGGLALLNGLPVVVIGHQKGEKITRNYGMAGPVGYRKALRLMDLAEQFKCPLFCFIDTPGADASAASESNGINFALAKCQERLFRLSVPVIAVIIGEGGSGGAVALGVANTVLMLEWATYSVITPDKAAAILWKDESLGLKAAELLKITADDAHRLGVVDGIVNEPRMGAHEAPDLAASLLKEELLTAVASLLGKDNLADARLRRFRQINNRLFGS